VIESKLLSIIISARNDSYTADYLKRLEFVINYNAHLICKYLSGSEFEIIISDYNSAIPLRKVLQINKRFIDAVKFIEYNDHEKSVGAGKEPEFHVSKASNMAIRRVTSKFILITGSDQFFSPEGIICLRNALSESLMFKENQTIYGLMPRRMLPGNFRYNSFELSEVDQYFFSINNSMFPFINQKINVGGGTGGLLFPTKKFAEMRGFCESWGGYGGQDGEFMGRVSVKYPHVDMSNFGTSLFKLPRTLEGARVNKVKRDKMPDGYYKIENRGNDSNWGHGKLDLPFKDSSYDNSQVLEQEFPSKSPVNPFLRDWKWSEIVQMIYKMSSISLFENIPINDSKDLRVFCFLSYIMERSQVKTVWIDSSITGSQIPILASRFVDLSITLIDTPQDAKGLDYNERCNNLMRSCFNLGHFANITGKRIGADQKLSQASLDANQILESAVIFDYKTLVGDLFCIEQSVLAEATFVIVKDAPSDLEIKNFEHYSNPDLIGYSLFFNEGLFSDIKMLRNFKTDKLKFHTISLMQRLPLMSFLLFYPFQILRRLGSDMLTILRAAYKRFFYFVNE